MARVVAPEVHGERSRDWLSGTFQGVGAGQMGSRISYVAPGMTAYQGRFFK
jgi:hypothetical protein